jgi:S-adenosylmethionine synthetase
MPLPIVFANRLCQALTKARRETLPYLRPDGKAQVTVEYSSFNRPKRIHTVLISAQHAEGISSEQLQKDLEQLARTTLSTDLSQGQAVGVDEKTRFLINPSGRFVLGGPAADCGVTGRKVMVDTYGSWGRHGGGAFSGKDPTKVDRSGAYAARYIAKNIVAARLASCCEVQMAYAIGLEQPVSVHIDTRGTGLLEDFQLEVLVKEVFDLRPQALIDTFLLRRPIYSLFSVGGHFGRSEEEALWEKTDRTAQLRQALRQLFPQAIALLEEEASLCLPPFLTG